MNRYLKSILLFDVAVPALFLGLPGCALLWGMTTFQAYHASKTRDFREHTTRVQQAALLGHELQPVQSKVKLLKVLLSNDDIEARIDRSVSVALSKRAADEIQRTLGEFQFGPSMVGPVYGEGHRLSLKFSSRWEPLHAAALAWETELPNLVLESLSIQRAAPTTLFSPSVEAAFTYFAITDD